MNCWEIDEMKKELADLRDLETYMMREQPRSYAAWHSNYYEDDDIYQWDEFKK